MPVCQRAPKPFTQFQPHSWVLFNIADVSCLHAVLCHDPELSADECVTHRSAARLPGLATDRFKQRIPGRHNTEGKEKLNRRVERSISAARERLDV